MSTTSDEAIKARLEQIGVRIDTVVGRARHAGDDVKLRVARRVDILRASEAAARTTFREQSATAAPDGSLVELEYALDEIDVELTIAEARLDADAAEDAQAFGAATERAIEAYGVHIEDAQARAARAGEHDRGGHEATVQSLRAHRAVAAERLRRYRAAETDAVEALRAAVVTALEDLDRVAQEADAVDLMEERAERLGRGNER